MAASLLYDGLISIRLEELARSRANTTAGAVDFSDLLSNEHDRFKIQAVTQARPAVTTAVVSKKEKEQKGDKNAKSVWLHKKEYLSHLSAEEGAIDKSATPSAVKTPRVFPSRPRKRSRPRRPFRSRSPKRRRNSPPSRNAQRNVKGGVISLLPQLLASLWRVSRLPL